MNRAAKIANLGAMVVPFVATVAAIVLLWGKVVSWHDLALFGVMYLVTAAGITVGYHRMLTHRSFRTHKPTEYVFASLGSMAVQGPVIAWVADHRKHHAHTDVEGDPHSPHVGHGEGVIGVLHGFWHAHMGWLLSEHGRADWKRYAPDLYEDRGMRLINRRFVSLVMLGLAIPALAGYLLTGTLVGAATGLLWGGLVRIFFVHHVTWSVNSVCHFLGSRRFVVEDQSTNGTAVDGALLRGKEKENGKDYRHTLEQGSIIHLTMTPPEEDYRFIVRIPQRDEISENAYQQNLTAFFLRMNNVRLDNEARVAVAVKGDATKKDPVYCILTNVEEY